MSNNSKEEKDKEEIDTPKDPANHLAKNKNIIDQEIGSFQDAHDTPKGYAEGHSMPALFGWITPEYQSQMSKELIELGKENSKDS